jgi:hypothetical protein
MGGRVGRKFCCFAFQGSTCKRSDFPIKLQAGLSVHFAVPFAPEDYWEEQWLGTVRFEQLTDSNLLILAECASNEPRVLNEEDVTLKQTATGLWSSILMHGVPSYSEGFFLSCAEVGPKTEVRRVGTLPKCYTQTNTDPFRIDEGVIRSADVVAAGRRTVCQGKDAFHRLKRGLHAWQRAVQERQEEYRLHQFVRAIEALLRPKAGKTRNQFVHRCQTLAKPSNEAREILGQIYDLRSAIEHMNDWQDVLDGIPENEKAHRAALRTYQAERLAGGCYVHLLSEINLLQLFHSDTSTDAFWALQDDERRKLWPEPIELETLALK